MNEFELEIRPITPDEFKAVLGVYQQCEDFLALGPQPTASMAMVEKDLEMSHEDEGIFCGIYNTEGTMLGIVDYIPNNFEGELHQAFLSLLMIAQPFRSQGIGQAVVDWVEQEIRKDARMTTILSGVQVNNPQAVRFWERNGYQIVSAPELMPDQTIAVRLRKDLRP